MATVTSVTKHFPTAKEGFVTTLASTISSAATTVPLNSVTGYANGDVAVFVVEPGSTNKQVFTGTVDTAGVQLTSVVWTEGTNVAHNAGSTVVDYVTATHQSMQTKGILVQHKQTGAHSAVTADSIVVTGSVTAGSFSVTGSGSNQGWETGMVAPNTVTHNGNRSYSLVFNSVNYSTLVSAGMRIRTTRTVAAPTQCTNLNGTTQYYSKASPAGMTWTDDFAAGAWIKVSSYQAGQIIGRYNGSDGWLLYLTVSGQVVLQGNSGGAGNTSAVTSYQSVPLNKWVHVAAQLDMSAFTTSTTTSYIMIDGVDVPCSVARAGTNPTALVQGAGNLTIGAQSAGAGLFFPGKIAQVFVTSAKLTQANAQIIMTRGITTADIATYSIASAYSFDNTLNDINTTNANNLTANGSAVATNADSPFGGQADGTISSTLDYGIIQKVTFSTNTTVVVQVPEGCTIPVTGGVTSVVYGSNKMPFGFPGQTGKWGILTLNRTNVSQAAPSAVTWYNPGSVSLSMPVGSWTLGYEVAAGGFRTGATGFDTYVTLSTTTSTESDTETSSWVSVEGASATIAIRQTFKREKDYDIAAITPYYLNIKTGAGNDIEFYGSFSPTRIYAYNAYL